MDLLESMVMSLSRFAARMVILILAVVNVLAYPPEEILSSNSLLKVVGNEKGGGSGGWLLFEDAFGPWRWMSVYFLILPSSSPQRISVSCL